MLGAQELLVHPYCGMARDLSAQYIADSNLSSLTPFDNH